MPAANSDAEVSAQEDRSSRQSFALEAADITAPLEFEHWAITAEGGLEESLMTVIPSVTDIAPEHWTSGLSFAREAANSPPCSTLSTAAWKSSASSMHSTRRLQSQAQEAS
ncbi:hypothetical protein MVEN_01658600 [Mycena venus]|uniref:Uncharacterized protein n=1 Tax=Mycena venus TaxID=2733690 RepID=A0A8H6XR56_9AGAR|nr:hypothetical protein MVEN_01658600 [Mycena venus]